MTLAFALTNNDPFWEQERQRLIVLCRYFTGSAMAAEDLVQETLYEAWRHRERLYSGVEISAWLTGIARNICRRWQSQTARERSQGVEPLGDEAETLIDPFDLDAMIEQAETRVMLERALAHLPNTTRLALLEHSLNGKSFATLAARHGIAEAALKMQVQRAKLRLRHLLTTTLAAELPADGVACLALARWLPTSLWCPRCGLQHLEGQWDFSIGTLTLRCRDCVSVSGIYASYTSPALFQGITSLKAGYNRVMRWVNATYFQAITQGGITCDCGRFIPLALHLPEKIPEGYVGISYDYYRQLRGMHLHCRHCNGIGSMMLSNLALYQPTAWRFWDEHKRIRALPVQEIMFQHQPALLLAFQSIAGVEQLDVIFAQANYAILDVRYGKTSYVMSSPIS